MSMRKLSQLLYLNSSSTLKQRALLIVSLIALSTTTSVTSHAAASEVPSKLPKSVTIHGGVLHAPPFAMVNDDGTYSGFQIDLLERAKIFAANDGVEFNMILDVAPTQYGASFDLVANDCTSDCKKFDMIVGNFYATPVRSMRAALSPAWLQSTISTIRYVNYEGPEILTLAQASAARASVCLKQGTFYSGLVMERYPDADYLFCAPLAECMDLLKQQKCVLYPDDELMLRYQHVNDPAVELTREKFNTQYIVWPMNFNMDATSSLLLKRWIFSALVNGTLDELYFNYFEKSQCPYGTAGKNCELYCHPDHGVSDLEGICVCESAKWTGDNCSIEVEEDFNFIPPTLKILGYVMFGINVVVVVSCAIWLYRKRHTAQIHVAQPSFLLLVLVGCFISSSTILAMAHEDYVPGNTDHACMAIPWTYSIGFSITFGTLFAKIRRIHKIFTSAANMRRTAVSTRETLSVIAVVLLVDFAVLITWTIVDPLHWQRDVVVADIFGEPLSSVGYCTCDHWQIFCAVIAALHFSLLGIASYLCYVTRNIATAFSQGKYIAIAMFSNLQIFIVGLPVLVIVGSDPAIGFFVRSIIIWMNDLAVVLVIFGKLMRSVHRHPEATVEDTIKNATKNYLSNSNHSAEQIQIPSNNANATNVNVIDATTANWLRCQFPDEEKVARKHRDCNSPST